MKTTVQEIPVEKIDPSPFQDRKQFVPAELDALALNIARAGQAVAALVRPGKGGRFELIHGERRWRACSLLADPKERARLAALEAADGRGNGALPAVTSLRCEIVEADDAQVVELQRSENRQRENLTALEEAAGYAQMLELKDAAGKPRYTRDSLAAKMGKSRSHVFERLRLLKAPAPIVAALKEGKIDASVAGLIVRVPREEAQKELLRLATKGDYGSPYSFRQLKEHIEEELVRDVRSAKFKADAALAPLPCLKCPKYGANLRAEFPDISPSTCLDPECYAKKEQAQALAELQKVAKDAKVLSREEYRNKSGHFIELKDKNWNDPKNRTWEQILKGQEIERLVTADYNGKPITVVPRAAAQALVKTAKLIPPDKAEERDRAEARVDERAVEIARYRVLQSAGAGKLDVAWLRKLLLLLLAENYYSLGEIYQNRLVKTGRAPAKNNADEMVRLLAEHFTRTMAQTDDNYRSAIVDVVLHGKLNPYGVDDAEDTTGVALTQFGVDFKSCQAEARKELAPPKKPKPGKAPKPAPAKAQKGKQ